MTHTSISTRPFMIEQAINSLRAARNMLRDSPKAQDAVRRALKSAEGALRHAERLAREERTAAAAPAPMPAHSVVVDPNPPYIGRVFYVDGATWSVISVSPGYTSLIARAGQLTRTFFYNPTTNEIRGAA